MTTVISSKDVSKKGGRTTRKRAQARTAPSEDEIRVLAYDLYLRREAEGALGDAVSDWIAAERELGID